MTVTLAIRFPLGRYHATGWNRSVNEGAVEWPPSPWRLLRALVATWYTRWPDLPAPVLDGLLNALGDPPAYRTPPAKPAHTRHYLPDLDHKKGETGGTDLTLDPYLSVPRDEELLVRWEAELTGEQRETLAKLVELLPYLGRADSVCEARLLDTDPVPDETWWRPDGGGTERVRLLAPARPIRRPLLEMTTVEVRKQRRTLPPETAWISYARTCTKPTSTALAAPPTDGIKAIRFAVTSRALLKATNSVLLADEVHRLVTRRLDGGRPEVLGHAGAPTDHQHAHWVPIPEHGRRGAVVNALLAWVPSGLTPAEVAQIINLPPISGRRGRGTDAYEVKGLPEVRLLLQAAGTVEQVAPELCGPARRWRSLTPYLPVRHRKRETLDEYLTADVRRELGYRNRDELAVTVSRPSPGEGLSERWSLEFRRRRMAEHLGKTRRGLGLRLEFDDKVEGPLLLGQLSHFGYGIFIPDPGGDVS